ncbi:MAG: MFS transporter, partial [Cyanobacteria bacterium P01_F01_bin.42]
MSNSVSHQGRDPKFSQEIWVLALGRLLSSIGTGLVLFYLPIFFVNRVGFSASIVGLAIASASISGVVGRFYGGVMVDSSGWGRRRTLFLAVFISGLGALVLAVTYELLGLFFGNLLLGLGTGLYWPATETMVADLSSPEHRRESYALT